MKITVGCERRPSDKRLWHPESVGTPFRKQCSPRETAKNFFAALIETYVTCRYSISGTLDKKIMSILCGKSLTATPLFEPMWVSSHFAGTGPYLGHDGR